MSTKKFWIVRDGQVGTAHLNRVGEVVDFRKAQPARLGLSEWTKQKAFILVDPAHGVEIETMSLEATVVSDETVWEDVGSAKVKRTWRAQFQGVEFFAEETRTERKATPEAVKFWEDKDLEFRQWKEGEERKKVFVATRLESLTAQELAKLTNPTASELGKLSGAAWQSVLNTLLERAGEAIGRESIPESFVSSSSSARFFWSADVRQHREQLRNGLLQIWEEAKAKKKAEFLAQK